MALTLTELQGMRDALVTAIGSGTLHIQSTLAAPVFEAESFYGRPAGDGGGPTRGPAGR